MLIVSCSETSESTTQHGTTIRTRSSELPASITRMGVSLLNNGQAENPFSFHNLLFNRVSGEEWQYNGTPAITFERSQSLVTVVAYAPYQEDVVYPLMNTGISVDQRTIEALAQSDLVYTYHRNMLAGQAIDLGLNHQFTNLRLKLQKGTEYASATDFKIEDVRLMQFPTTATFNLKDSTLTNISGVNNIRPFRSTAYPVEGPLAEFQAIVLPQQIASGIVMFEIDFFVNGKSQTTKVITTQQLNLPRGAWAEFEVKVGNDLSIDLTDANISVQDWLPGSLLFRELLSGIPTLTAQQIYDPNVMYYDKQDLRKNYFLLRVTGTMDNMAWSTLSGFTNLQYLQLPAGSLCPKSIQLNSSYANYMVPHVANISELTLRDNSKLKDRGAGISRMVCAIKTPFTTAFEDVQRAIPYTEVASYSFKNCSQLTLFFSPTTYIIGQQAFMNCSLLSTLACPFVNEIQSQVFWGCSSLESMILNYGSAIKELGEGAFGNMANLRILRINNSLIKLSAKHFGGATDTSLIDLTVYDGTGVNLDKKTINGVQFKSITIAQKWSAY